ncbi:DUF4183 domain-containing protein [Paenibacillus thermoaerophilus]|uniref:DUF4183 domain-containing protein n=1 Tax=Paenibacillus thermoaerophilus TaxID=1215385 RepID=A0ABW2UX86_9BACL|nr:DUF4183 domain-containing protein [Paenibacillus thermoaerophilus]
MIDTVAHTTTVPDTSFFDDNGDPVTAGGLPVPPAGGYLNVYVNGMLQAGGLSALTNTQLACGAGSSRLFRNRVQFHLPTRSIGDYNH